MNAPIIWIVIPAFFSMITLFLRRYDKALLIAGAAFTVIWGFMALVFPSSGTIELGLVTVQVEDTLIVIGRQFILKEGLREVTALIYFAVAFWFGGAYFAQVPNIIVPIGSGIASLSIAALSVEPFLYAPLFIEVAVLLSVPFLVPLGSAAGRGVIRYLVFQTLGIPFILFAGWMLTELSPGPTGFDLEVSLGVTLGLGFAFLMAIFPLHSWIPMMAEEVHPYVLSFVFFFFPLMTTLFGLKMLNRYPWIFASTPETPSLILLVGALMAVVGGFWTAFQRHLSRIMAFVLVTDIGLVLLLLGASVQENVSTPTMAFIMALIVSRGLSLAVWSLALSTLTESVHGKPLHGFRFHEIQGAAQRYPISVASLILAHLSIAGFPLLAGFPVRLGSYEILFRVSPWVSIVAVISSLGVLTAAMRTTAVLVMGDREGTLQISENLGQRVTLAVGGAAIILIGVFPQWFVSAMTQVGISFINAVR